MTTLLSCQLVIIVGALALVAGAQVTTSTPPTTIFADNYHVRGMLSLPYAELNEPFSAYYDKQLERSRADYYGGEYQVYQYGPKSSPDSSYTDSNSTYGSIYKLVYVPADFHRCGDVTAGSKSRARFLLKEAIETLPFRRHDATGRNEANKNVPEGDAQNAKTATKRVCFDVQGGVGFTISALSVLPKLNDFHYDSTVRCPQIAGSEHRATHQCELWKFSSVLGDKKNVYKFWVRRDEQNLSLAIPVHYYMLGYDSLLGSHYDRYDIS